MLPRFSKLKYDLALSHQTESATGNAFHCCRIVPEVVHLGAKAGHIARKLGIFRSDLRKLLGKRPHARQPLWLENKEGRADQCDPEHGEREGSLQKIAEGEVRGGHEASVSQRGS